MLARLKVLLAESDNLICIFWDGSLISTGEGCVESGWWFKFSEKRGAQLKLYFKD